MQQGQRPPRCAVGAVVSRQIEPGQGIGSIDVERLGADREARRAAVLQCVGGPQQPQLARGVGMASGQRLPETGDGLVEPSEALLQLGTNELDVRVRGGELHGSFDVR